MPATLTHHSYGKSQVHLTRVRRFPDRHEIREWTVAIRLAGDFAASYTQGDNSAIIATDTMKNLVYALAADRSLEPIEDFGALLAAHFLTYPPVQSARVELAETAWQRIEVAGSPHPHAFVGGGSDQRSAMVQHDRAGVVRIAGGLRGLQVLKTAHSGFVGFLRDRYTTLPETTDRIFATEIQAEWSYAPGTVGAWDDAFAQIRSSLLTTFATHDSRAVQETLHAMGTAVLAAVPTVEEITLTLPNQHRIPVDLTRFDCANTNEIFAATAEPFGVITGTLRRSGSG